MDSVNYINVLKSKLLSLIALYNKRTGDKPIFQQDNALTLRVWSYII